MMLAYITMLTKHGPEDSSANNIPPWLLVQYLASAPNSTSFSDGVDLDL